VDLDGEKKPRAKVPSSDTRVLPGESGLPGTRLLRDAHICIKLNEHERNKRMASMETERTGILSLLGSKQLGTMENDHEIMEEGVL